MEAFLLVLDLLLMILFLNAIGRAEKNKEPEDLSGFFAYKSEKDTVDKPKGKQAGHA